MHLAATLAPDTWSGIATAWATISSAVILVAGFLLAWGQLTALNKATQLDNFMTLTQEIENPQFMKASLTILQLDYNPQTQSLNAENQEQTDSLSRVLNFFERVGMLVRKKYLDEQLAIDWFGSLAKKMYDVVGVWIETRQQTHPYSYCEYTGFVHRIDEHWKEIGRDPIGRV